MRIVVDIPIIEVQEYHILEMVSERLSIIVSQLGILSYFILSVNLLKQGLNYSELIDWLVRNTQFKSPLLMISLNQHFS